MATDMLWPLLGLSTETDPEIDETYLRDFLGAGYTNDTTSSRWSQFYSSSASGIPSSDTLDPSQRICTTSWQPLDTERLEAQYGTTLERIPVHISSYAQIPINTRHVTEEVASRTGFANARPIEAPCQVSKRPMPSDWCRWEPTIVAKYKRATVRMILKDLHSEGFDVTEKMLRERIRKWGINTKNKRATSSTKSINGKNRPAPWREDPNEASLTGQPQASMPTNPNDVAQRRLLSVLDHYLESNWVVPVNDHEGDRAVRIMMALGNAIELAANDHSRAGWTTLQNAEIELQGAAWSRISIRNIVRMLSVLGQWSIGSDDMSRRLQQLVQRQFSGSVGQQHPLVLMMGVAIDGQLGVETCSRLLTVTDMRAKSASLNAEEKAGLVNETRLAYIAACWRCDEFKIMEQALNAWLPVNIVEQCEKLWRLGKIKLELREYEQAERMFTAARALNLDTTLHLDQVTNIAMGLFDTLMGQQRPGDAAEIFLTGLSCYDELTRTKLDRDARALNIDWFRWRAVGGRAVGEQAASAQCGEMDSVMAKLDAMSLAL